MKIPSIFSQNRITGGALVLAVTQFGASLAGLIRDRMLASTFPGLDTVDVYIAAFRPSDFLFQMLIMSAVGTILVPMLTKYHVRRDTEETENLLGAAMGMGSLVFGTIAVILAVFFSSLAPFFVDFTGETLQLYIAFGRIVLISDLLMVIGNISGQYLITVQRYWIYGLTPIVYSLATVFGTLALTPLIGAYGPIVGTAGGALLYALLRCFAVRQSGIRIRPRLWHGDITHVGWLMLPRMLALGALQLELLLFDKFASGLPSGAITINAYARNFQSVAVGVIGIALAQASFSHISRAAALGAIDRFWRCIRQSLILVTVLTIPCSVALVLLAPFAAWLIALDHRVLVFSIALSIYAFSILFESANHVLLRGFYAFHRTDIPAIWSILNVVIAVGSAWYLLPHMGVYALGIGFGLGQVIQMIGLSVSLLTHRATSNVSKPSSGTF